MRRLLALGTMKRARIVVPVSLALVAVVGCDRPGKREKLTGRESGPQVAVEHEDSVDRVREKAANLFGRRVTVNGELSPRAGGDARVFTLRGRGTSAATITLLTRSPVVPAGPPLEPDAHVVVSGTVRRFSAPELERELGWDVPSDLERELGNEPVLVVDEIRHLARPETTWSEPRRAT